MSERYRVYGRTEHAEPLTERGSLEAATPEAASRLATERFGEDWVELALVPESAVRWLLRGAEPKGEHDAAVA